MTKRGILASLMLLAVLAACSQTLSPSEGQRLVREYLAPFKVEGLTFKSMTRSQVPGAGDAFVVVADFTVPFEGRTLHPLPGQTFYLTFNELSHRYEVNPQLTHVAQGVQGMIDITKTADYMKTHPYNPSPWNPR
jgi:hypothetical protein